MVFCHDSVSKKPTKGGNGFILVLRSNETKFHLKLIQKPVVNSGLVDQPNGIVVFGLVNCDRCYTTFHSFGI